LWTTANSFSSKTAREYFFLDWYFVVLTTCITISLEVKASLLTCSNLQCSILTCSDFVQSSLVFPKEKREPLDPTETLNVLGSKDDMLIVVVPSGKPSLGLKGGNTDIDFRIQFEACHFPAVL
jgi:hypothetical protein